MILSNEPFLLQQQNAGNAVLMLHGLGGGVYELSLLGAHLHRIGHTVCGINYPGHDTPAKKMPASQWEDWYAHTEETLERLKKHHDTVSIIGFSTGSMVGLELTHNHPEIIDRLVLLSPFLKVRHHWYLGLTPEKYLEMFGGFVCDLPRPGLPIEDREMMKAAHGAVYFKTFNTHSIKSALKLIDRVKPKLCEITQPALIIQSPRDRVVCASGAEYLMENLGSEQKEILWLERSNHVVTLDVERDRVTERVTHFLSHPQQESVRSAS